MSPFQPFLVSTTLLPLVSRLGTVVPVVPWPAMVLLLALAFMEPELFSILNNLAVVTEAELLVSA